MRPVSIAIVHRHGSRFPSSIQPGNFSFPEHSKFWEHNSMLLTPQGMSQMVSLGIEIAEEYPYLVTNRTYEDIADSVRVYSSNTTRTILSALSLLDGIFPGFPYHITCGSPSEMFHITQNKSSNMGVSNGIRVSVEEVKSCDSLFHLGKCDIENKEWREKNLHTSPQIEALCERDDVNHLLYKLYAMTYSDKLDPNIPMKKRLLCMTEYLTLMRYARDHNTPLLPNILMLELTDDEKKLIVEISNVIYSHHFRHHNNTKKDEKGTECVGMLMSEISRFFTDFDHGIRIFSAHDTTLLAIAACLGIIIPSPDYSAYFIFEKYIDNTIAIKFNPDPARIDLRDLKPILIDGNRQEFIHVNDISTGRIQLKDFLDIANHKEYSISTVCLKRIAHALATLENKSVLPDVCVPLPDEIKKNFIRIFNFYDINGDGKLCPKELYDMFSRMDLPITKEGISTILDGKECITQAEFLCIMGNEYVD